MIPKNYLLMSPDGSMREKMTVANTGVMDIAELSNDIVMLHLREDSDEVNVIASLLHSAYAAKPSIIWGEVIVGLLDDDMVLPLTRPQLLEFVTLGFRANLSAQTPEVKAA